MFVFNLFVSAKVFPSYYFDLATALFLSSPWSVCLFSLLRHKKIHKHKLPPTSESLSVYKSVDFHLTNELFRGRLYWMLNLNRIWSTGVPLTRRGKRFKLMEINTENSSQSIGDSPLWWVTWKALTRYPFFSGHCSVGILTSITTDTYVPIFINALITTNWAID